MRGRSSWSGRRRRGPLSAPRVSELPGSFRITHPFHPRRGEEIELLAYRRGFNYERVEGRDAGGALVSVPLGFTNAGLEEDPFLALSGGRALFRAGDLLRLAELLSELGS
jgi:hypothetical protein